MTLLDAVKVWAFPEPTKINRRRIAWSDVEIEKWKQISDELGGIGPSDIRTATDILAVRAGKRLARRTILHQLVRTIAFNAKDEAIRRMNARHFVVRNEGGRCLVGEESTVGYGSQILHFRPNGRETGSGSRFFQANLIFIQRFIEVVAGYLAVGVAVEGSGSIRGAIRALRWG